MGNEIARNRGDAQYIDASFALSATTGVAAYSDTFDLGADVIKPETVEVELVVPALGVAAAPNSCTVIAGIELSAAAAMTTPRTMGLSEKVASTGVAAQTLRGRLPSDALRYIRGFVVVNDNATSGGDTAATYEASFALKF
jgi:hypothetical protein